MTTATNSAEAIHEQSAVEGRRITVTGIVQGVGFRPFVHRLARAEGITGRVRNDAATRLGIAPYELL